MIDGQRITQQRKYFDEVLGHLHTYNNEREKGALIFQRTLSSLLKSDPNDQGVMLKYIILETADPPVGVKEMVAELDPAGSFSLGEAAPIFLHCVYGSPSTCQPQRQTFETPSAIVLSLPWKLDVNRMPVPVPAEVVHEQLKVPAPPVLSLIHI